MISVQFSMRGVSLVRAFLPIILANLMPIIGVAFLGWRVEEVLLTYWVETVVMLLATPFWLWIRYGRAGLLAGMIVVPFMGVFVAGHAFFLAGMLYDINWANVQGGPLGWSADPESADRMVQTSAD